ncbi:MAG: cytochrome P450, partial [Chloroflexota bacterium]
DTMTHYATAMVDRWRDGEQLDVNDEMMAVTLDIIAATLLKDASNPGIREIPEILHFIQAQYRSVMMMPSWVVEIALRRTDSRVRRLDEIVYPIIEARRATGGDEGDILSMLLNARDDDGVGMTDLEVRDEIVILFLAGHETTANTLNWTFYLLSQHPDVEAKLHKEVDRVLAGRVPTLADLQSLPYTAQVVKEAMRLYPPVPYIGREVVEDIDMGDFTLPAGSMVSILQYLTHRDGQIWDNPLAFDPDRFSPERENEVHKWAFFPFGGGARVCIGNGFAMMEAPLVLATVASRYRLELAPGAEVVPQSSITLYPKHGLSMIARRRDPELTQPTREDRVVLA